MGDAIFGADEVIEAKKGVIVKLNHAALYEDERDIHGFDFKVCGFGYWRREASLHNTWRINP